MPAVKKQIIAVSVLQNAKVAAALYFVISLPFLALIAIGMAFAPSESGMGAGMGIGMVIIMPLMYAFFGFIFTLIFAWLYNLVAKRVGGFEFTTAEMGSNAD